jgi:hypothetical protein
MCEKLFCCTICEKTFSPLQMIKHAGNAHLPQPVELDAFAWLCHDLGPGCLAALAEPAADLTEGQLHRFELDLLFSHQAAEMVKQVQVYERA